MNNPEEHGAGVGAGIAIVFASVLCGGAIFFLIGWYVVPWVLGLRW